MIIHKKFKLPTAKERLLTRAKWLEVCSIISLCLIALMMYAAMGSSQAMKTAWFEDLISLLPPFLFLISLHWRSRAPNKEFPYGYRRIMMISFFGASIALVSMGLFLLGDAAHTLISGDRPSIGHTLVFGERVWEGWIMIGALALSTIPPVILGHLKIKVARELHEKTLYADAKMNKADWMTALGAIVGVIGISIGWWWADAVAAGFISLDILKDGFSNLKNSIADLMDRRPTDVEGRKTLALCNQIRDAITSLPGIKEADIRLREDGQVVIGELFIVASEAQPSPSLIKKAVEAAKKIDWRIHDLVVQPVRSLHDPQSDWIQK